MTFVSSLGAVFLLALIGWFGTRAFGLTVLFGVILPYLALLLFLAGFTYRIIRWGASPVPFCIPSVCGQQKSLPWIKGDGLESPGSRHDVVRRMVMEIVCFRSLFRNDRTEILSGRLFCDANKFLWLGGLVFHGALVVIALRHLRLFFEPVPLFVLVMERVDGFLDLGNPAILVTDVLILVALLYLTVRRLSFAQMRFISLPSDYFVLFLVMGVLISGVLMRHVYRVDVAAIKNYATTFFLFNPHLPPTIEPIFYVHLFLASIFFAYFPFSKLIHSGGVFFSPTRNLMNNSRMTRHVNPWNYPVKTHTYEEWEDEFRDALKEAGLPVEKEEQAGGGTVLDGKSNVRETTDHG